MYTNAISILIQKTQNLTFGKKKTKVSKLPSSRGNRKNKVISLRGTETGHLVLRHMIQMVGVPSISLISP